jgi:lipoprotein NlpD
MDPQDIAQWNEISSPYVIHPGQKLTLIAQPANNRERDRSSSVQISTAKSPGQATTKTVDKPKQSSQTESRPTTTSSTAGVTRSAKTPAASNVDPKNWNWPTDGRVFRTYLANDPARNGLDIAGREGQAINATSAGQVVYSGNGLIGYGELIIIKHSEKMLSAYAHNKTRLVSEGEQVLAGQKIAEMGRNAGNEQILHFEIRVRGKPVDPLIYLPKK